MPATCSGSVDRAPILQAMPREGVGEVVELVSEWLVRWRWPLFVGFLVVTALLLPAAASLTYDRSIYSFFDPGHPMLETYKKVEAEFGGDSICVAVYEDTDLLSPEGMQRLAKLRDDLRAVEGVRGVTTLADLRRPTQAMTAKTIDQWFRDAAGAPEKLDRLKAEIVSTDLYRNQFVGADGQTAALLVLLDPNRTDSKLSRKMIGDLRRAMQQEPYRGTLVGAPVLLNDFFDKMEEDSWTLTTISIGTMGLVILILFRNWRWVVLPMLIVFSSIIWLRGGIVYSGLQLGFTIAMTTSLMCVIGIATTILVAVSFREEMQKDGVRVNALRRSFRKVLPSIFWNCVTTTTGFGALAVSRVAPVRDFGIAMAAACLVVGIAVFFLLPGGILLGRSSATPQAAPGEATLASSLVEVERLVTRYSWAAAAAAVVAIGGTSIGMLWLEVETDFTKNFRRNSPILEGYQFAENRLEGAGLLGLSFDAPEKLTPAFLDSVRDMENQLREIDGVTKVIGLTDFLDFADQSVQKTLGRLPLDPAFLLPAKLKAIQNEMPREIAQFWNQEQGRMRIILRVQERKASRDKTILLAKAEQIGREALEDRAPESVRATGLYVMLVHLMDSLVGDQWSSMLISSTSALLCLSIAFGSLRIGVAAFIPNIIPVAAVVGLMGWLGMKVNAATAMIQAISVGLAVDFSIHYIYGVLEEVRGGVPFQRALAKTHNSIGKAMVFASLALMLGFGVLAFSNFLPTMQFGLLVSLAMGGGLVGNLVLLPVLLTWFTPRRIQERGLESTFSFPTAATKHDLEPVDSRPPS